MVAIARRSAKAEPAMTRKTLMARVHVGAKTLGMDEDTRRAWMENLVGQRSCIDCTDGQLKRLADDMKRQGATTDRWRPSQKRYVRKIWALWGDMKRRGLLADAKDPRAWLVGFVRRQTGVDNPEWLSPDQANKVIEGLKSIIDRAPFGDADAGS